ncbi:hypothetical protein [Affinirhizobium pseudoryzae]|uniref:hypothetical protein n=1 Tax=Allorhizobium pseudoryzae TaxID=379684 RepID=UPI0013EC7FC4|nr:hypothetical protein [Allorhizobium pseudoryzae]
MTKVETFPEVPGAAETLALLQGSSVVQKAKAEKALRLAEERKVAVQLRDKLDIQREKHFHQKTLDLKKQADVVQAAERALHDAKVAYGELFRKHMWVGQDLDHQFDELTRQLLQSYDPAIDLFTSDMRDELDKAHRSTRVSQEIVERHPVTGKISRRFESNFESVNQRIAAIRDAMDAAERMKLEADQSNISERLQLLRNELPAVKP